MSPGEGLPRTLEAIKTDGEFRSLVGPPGCAPWVSGSPHPSSVQTALDSSTQARVLPLTAAGGGRESLFALRGARKARGGWTSSPGCRLPAPKPGSSYLPHRRSTFSTETNAPAPAPLGAPAANCVCAGAERSTRVASHPPPGPGQAAKNPPTSRRAGLGGAWRPRAMWLRF